MKEYENKSTVIQDQDENAKNCVESSSNSLNGIEQKYDTHVCSVVS